jgi:hypothetical protein
MAGSFMQSEDNFERGALEVNAGGREVAAQCRNGRPKPGVCANPSLKGAGLHRRRARSEIRILLRPGTGAVRENRRRGRHPHPQPGRLRYSNEPCGPTAGEMRRRCCGWSRAKKKPGHSRAPGDRGRGRHPHPQPGRLRYSERPGGPSGGGIRRKCCGWERGAEWREAGFHSCHATGFPF